MRDQLDDAALTTSKAFSLVRSQRPQDDSDNSQAQTVSIDDMLSDKTKDKDDKKMSPEIAVMQPILRLLQLLCENHNRDLQVSTCLDNESTLKRAMAVVTL